MKHTLPSIKKFVIAHKGATLVGIAIVGFVGFKVVKTVTATIAPPRYVVEEAKKDTIVVSISGSGQVSASNQVDIKPKTVGDIYWLGVVQGQSVKAGQIIAQLNARDALKAVRDAEVNLQSAKLALQKLQKPPEKLTVLQAENAILRAKDAKLQAEQDLKKAYEDGFTSVANAFLDLPTIISDLKDMLYTTSAGLSNSGQSNIDFYAGEAARYDIKADQLKINTVATYQIARADYDKNFIAYKATTRFSDTVSIVALIDETYGTAKNMAEAVKSVTNLIQFYQDTIKNKNQQANAVSVTHIATLGGFTGKTSAHLANLLAIKNTIRNASEAITNADRGIAENTQSLTKLLSGTDELDIASAELTVKQRQNALQDAREKLSDYSVRAPFAGTIAKLYSKRADAVSASTVVGTLITKQKLANISLNEVDVAKVNKGQKATLTFDAVPGLTVSGSVSDIDTIGTVTQGVVTYNVQISFDTQDDRVKPGMSATAAIIIDVKSNVLAVSSSAVKTRGSSTYVEVFNPPLLASTAGVSNSGIESASPPAERPVEIGISSDTKTEVVSGLSQGEQVVVRTITAAVGAARTTQAPSIFGAPGGGRGGGGGAIRIPR